VKSLNGDAELTRDGAIVGSPLYMAPEQGRGEDVDHRADIYSLGCALYHMLTGRPPFTGPRTWA
jgi:serine/threonine protein kinase